MRTAKDIMTANPITVTSDTELSRAAEILLEKRINGLPVVDGDGNLIGIICQSDLIAQQKKLPIPSFFALLDSFIPLISMKQLEKEVRKVAAATVGEIMIRKPTTITPDTPLEVIATLMVEKKYHSLPVVSAGKVCGIVGKEDVLKTLMVASATDA